jgi:hypothetical protein
VIILPVSISAEALLVPTTQGNPSSRETMAA